MTYTHQVNYSKRFVTGILSGRLYHDNLRFTSLANARAFAAREGEIIKPCIGSDQYRIEDAQVIDLARFA